MSLGLFDPQRTGIGHRLMQGSRRVNFDALTDAFGGLILLAKDILRLLVYL